MAIRTTESLVTFRSPFTLRGLEEPQAAGTYRVVTDEAEIEGLSFLAYQRVSTMLHLPAVSAGGLSQQVFEVDGEELDAVVAAQGDKGAAGA